MEKLRTRIFLFLIVPFLFYFLVGTFVHVMGFWNLQEMYLVEKALLAVKGEPARFENVGLTYPPLPFLLLFLPVSLGVHLQAGVLLSSIYGALVILFLSSTLRDRLGFFFFPLIALHPLFLYSYSGGESIGLFLFLILLFIYFHKRFLESEEKDSFSLFMSSFLLGLSVLVRYEAVLFIFPVVCTLIFDKNPWRLVSKLIVFLFPTLFLFIGWAHLNWIYVGDPFHFTRSFLFLSQKLPGSEVLGFKGFMFALLLFPAYVISIMSLTGKPRLLILFLSPLIVFLISAWLLDNPLPLSYFCLLGGVSLIFMEINRGLVKRVSVLASLVGLLVSFALPGELMWGEEKDFTQFLTFRDTKEMFKEEREVASYLRQLDGKIFFDDTYNYPVVFFHGNPKQFVLPYQFKFGFYLKYPFLISKYVLVPNPKEGKDLVNENNRSLFFEEGANGKIVKESGRWRVFESTSLLLSREK